jgi:hypothetical protein
MEQEGKSEISEQTSEFRKEALNSTDKIVEISKGLKEALDSQSASIDRAENEIAASSQAEETQAATITGISNSLSELLVVQKEILDSLTGLNKSIDTATQQQGDDAGGDDGDAGAAGGGGDARHAAFGGAITGANPFLALASYSGGGGGGGGGGYGGGGGTAPSIPKGEMAETLKAGIVERLVSDEELAVDPEKAEMIAEAFVLNFDDESDLDPNVIERELNVHGTRGKGLYQLTDTDPGVGRRSDYEAIYGDDYSVENQLDFLVHELKTSESSAWSGIKDSETVGEAAGKIVRDFLRPAEQYKIERSNRYSGDVRTTSDFDGVVEIPESIDGALTPLSLNWVGEELPEGITEGSNEITLTDPDSGEEFSVNFEVENIDGNLTTVGPVTLAQDTDLEGISGAAGDPVEVSAEMAQDLADQIGATLEPTDPETPATPEELGADNNIPETMATAVGLENPVMDNPPTEGTAAESQASQTQTAAADYGEDKTTPVSFTGGKWNKQVNDYFGVA